MMDRLEKWMTLDKLLPGFRPRGIAPVKDTVGDHVIIAGYGLNGRNLASVLRAIDVPHLIVELNSQSVRQARSRGEPAFYGDATREEILRALGIERARMFVVAISDPAATRRMVRVARSLNPKVHIIARTRYIVEIAELTALGANVVIPEEFETSIEIFARVLSHYEVPRHDIDRLAQQIRASHYEALRAPAHARPSLTGIVTGLPQMAAERIPLTPGAPAIGLTLAETQLRSRTGALVLSLTRGESDIATPDPTFRLAEGDVLVVVGQPLQLKAAREVLSQVTVL
jgi:CPA2 family monovalent cation:H+ antiporter-2